MLFQIFQTWAYTTFSHILMNCYSIVTSQEKTSKQTRDAGLVCLVNTWRFALYLHPGLKTLEF